MSILDSHLTNVPDFILYKLRTKFKGFNADFTNVKYPYAVWTEIENLLSGPEETLRKRLNGCGSTGLGWTVPDTIWGLRVTPICIFHDITHNIAQDEYDCHLSNMLFISNMLTFISYNSKCRVLAGLRSYRAITYFNVVQLFNKDFCNGFKNETQ